MTGRTSIEIATGDWRAAIRPAAGGALAALSRRDHDVLRPMPEGSTNPLDAACFPLVPYANRIRRGRFTLDGEAITLPANNPPEIHSLHGLAWQRPWLVETLLGASVTLVQDHGGKGSPGGWPWAYRATQNFTLSESGLTITLGLTNASERAMPAGLGLHPYFRRWSDSRVRFAARAVVLSDVQLIPTGEMDAPDIFAPWAKGATLPPFTIDHCHADWDGQACITDGLGTITLTASNAPHLHVYAPAAGSELCLEPVNHLPDAVNRDEWQMPMLAPGESCSMALHITEE